MFDDGNTARDSESVVQSYTDLLRCDGNRVPNVFIEPDDAVFLPYSSGTTGVPKGVMLTHRNWVTNIIQLLYV